MEVRERVTRDGEIRIPPDLDAGAPQIAALVATGLRNARRHFPCMRIRTPRTKHGGARPAASASFPDLFVSVSSEVSPEIREYERTCTTVCNAYVQPVMDRYIRRIEAALTERGFGGRFLLMLSSGTLATPDVA